MLVVHGTSFSLTLVWRLCCPPHIKLNWTYSVAHRYGWLENKMTAPISILSLVHNMTQVVARPRDAMQRHAKIY